MGKAEKVLLEIFQKMNFLPEKGSLPVLNQEIVAGSEIEEEVLKVYGELGGAFDYPLIRPPSWDFCFHKMALEIDDTQHFNRYRGRTLFSSLYQRSSAFDIDKYKRYCLSYENECMKMGKIPVRWTSVKADAEFGPGSLPGDLSGNGSPSWRRRAFNDFLKDISPMLIPNFKLLRISVWDQILVKGELVPIHSILKYEYKEWDEGFMHYIERRINEL